MALVTAHLSTAGRRARQVFSRRLQATVLTVALVLGSAAPPGVAIAQEADQGREGIAAPEQAAPDSTADPDFDPGSETELPFDVGAPDSDDDSGGGAPVDIEPVDDPEASAPLDDPSAIAPDAIQGNGEVAPPVEAVPPADPVAPPAPPAPAPAPPPPAATTPLPPAADTPAPKREKRATAREPRRDRAHHRRVTHVTAPPAAPAPAAAPVETTATVQPVAEVAAPAPNDPARPGQNSHTVQPGESLWTIASDLLDAGATDAQIAAETTRLYRLNRDRIGDDPNMLITGTVLRLR